MSESMREVLLAEDHAMSLQHAFQYKASQKPLQLNLLPQGLRAALA